MRNTDADRRNTRRPLRSLLGADSALREFLPEFVAQLPVLVAAVERLLAEHDLDELRKQVHHLKGAGGFYGFPQITEAATEAERRLKTCASPAAVQEGVEALVRLVRSVDGYDGSREQESAKTDRR